MRTLRILTLAALAAAGSASAGDDEPGKVVETSYDAPDGTRVLRHEMLLRASPGDVWTALTTAEGWKAGFGIPFVKMDFRLGGLIETSYDAKAVPGLKTNIRNRVLSYLPLRMVSMQAEQAPPGFPAPELLPHLFTVMDGAEGGDGLVRITVSGVAYGKGEAYDKVYRLFQEGNAWTLRRLHEHFEKRG